MVAGFVIGALAAAAVGAGSRASTITGLVLALVGMGVAAVVLVRGAD
jgi:hypothetical protein